MAITASNITVAQNPSDPTGTVATFIRSDTGVQVTIPVAVHWTGTANASVQEVKAAITSWVQQANGLAAVNTAAVGQTV